MSGPVCPDCGKGLRSGQRFEAQGTVKVLVCLDPKTGAGCGYETPALYGRKKHERNWNDEYLPLSGGSERETFVHGGTTA